MTRLALLLAATAALCVPVPAPAAPAPPRSWAAAEIERAVAGGIFGGTPAAFRPDAPLTRQELEGVLARLGGRNELRVANGARPVTLAQLDAALVRAAGLGGAAASILRTARAAGLAPPSRFGTEAVARLLGLRLNHPAADDALELRPDDPATRAEAAFSVARLLTLAAPPRIPSSSAAAARIDVARAAEVERIRALAAGFALPPLDERQRQVLQTAAGYAGFPYVWGGTGDGTPGFDCSGFVWRVFRLTEYPGEPALAGVLRGRTSMDMSGEVAPSARIALDAIEPGDVLFFGRGPRSKPAQVDHMGIYLGSGWMIHSSSQGVALAPLEGWWEEAFAWARRPLAEAGESVAPTTGPGRRPLL